MVPVTVGEPGCRKTSLSVPDDWGEKVSATTVCTLLSPAAMVTVWIGCDQVPELSCRIHWYFTTPPTPLVVNWPVAVVVPR